jgi:hypothetical protein
VLGDITERLLGRRKAPKVTAPAPGCVGSDSEQPGGSPGRTGSESVRRQLRLQHRSAQEHAHRLLAWVHANVDLDAFGLVLHQDVLVWYSEMCIEADLMERSWNPVGRAFDLLTTDGAKPYAWIFTKCGKKVRRRHYPIPLPLLFKSSARPLRSEGGLRHESQ